MKNLKLLFVILLVSFCSYNGKSQDQKIIDSLNLELKKHKERKIELGIKKASLFDTAQIKILNELNKVYTAKNPDKSMNYATQILALSKEIGHKKGIGIAYNTIGFISSRKGDTKTALKYFNKAVKIFNEIGFKKGLAKVYINMANCFPNDGIKSVKYLFRGLKMFEEINDKAGIAFACTGISGTYLYMGNWKLMLNYAFKSLKISTELGDKSSMATNYTNIGVCYLNQKMRVKAMTYLLKASVVLKEVGDINGLSVCYSNIAANHEELKNYEDALKYQTESLKLAEQVGDKSQIVSNLLSFGSIYIKQKKYKLAKEFLNRSIVLSEEMGRLDYFAFYYRFMHELNAAQGDHQESLKNYIQYRKCQDSLQNTASTHKIAEMQNKYDSEKKEALQKEIQSKKDALAKADKKRQFLMTILFASISLAIAIITILVFRSLKNTKKQKLLIEAKQKEIMDSIRYAKRIQQALLPSEKSIVKGLARFNTIK